MTGATLTRPPVRHRETRFSMQPQLTTCPLFGDSRLPARFWNKVQVQPNGCWVWKASLFSTGYGCFNVDGRIAKAHRFAYEVCVCPVPDNKQLDHLCRNRACVNLAHLEIVTHQENTLRGVGLTAQNARKTHCPQGHPYDEVNTKVYDGRRYCRACRRERKRLSRILQ